MRMVWNSSMDRRPSTQRLLSIPLERLADCNSRNAGRAHADGVDILPPFLGLERSCDLSRNGPVAHGGELGCAVCHDHDGCPGVVGINQSSWTGTDTCA